MCGGEGGGGYKKKEDVEEATIKVHFSEGAAGT